MTRSLTFLLSLVPLLAVLALIPACGDDTGPGRGFGGVPATELPPVGIRDGSFEAAEPGGAPSPAWSSNDVGNVIAPLEEAPADARIGFPSHGERWLRLDAGHFGPSTKEDYLRTSSQVRQAFRCGDRGFVLALDLAFTTYEIPGKKGSNDFVAVDVLQGERRKTVARLDNASAEFPLESHGGKPTTAREIVAVDLREAFGSAVDGDTPFELVISIANVNDEGMDSKAYADDVRLQEKKPLRPFDTRVVRGEDGRWRIESVSPAHAGMGVRHYVTRTLSRPTGSGPFFGLAFDHAVLAQQSAETGQAPWSVTLDESGRFLSEPLDHPKGTQIDYVGLVMQGGKVLARAKARTIVLD